MAPRICLFLSHSSRDTDFTRALVSALEDETRTSPFDLDIRVDYRDIEAGDNWLDEIHEWMYECHAAVVLLSPHALDPYLGSWVLKEATVLSWRALREDDFRLFWVDIEGLGADAPRRSHLYSPLALDRIQSVGQGSPEAVAAVIRGALKPTRGADGTPMGKLTAVLETLLDRAGAAVVRQSAAELGVDLAGSASNADAAVAVARHFVREGVVPVHKLIHEISATVEQRDAERILQTLAPLWVDMVAAGRLRIFAEGGSSFCGLNGEYVSSFTGEMYVRRAHPATNFFDIYTLSGGTNGDPTFVSEQIRSEVLERHPEAREQEFGAFLQARKFPIFVVLPEQPDPLLLAQLERDFPTLHFLFSSGRTLPEDAGPESVSWLQPPVDLDLEEQAYDHWLEAQQGISLMPS